MWGLIGGEANPNPAASACSLLRTNQTMSRDSSAAGQELRLSFGASCEAIPGLPLLCHTYYKQAGTSQQSLGSSTAPEKKQFQEGQSFTVCCVLNYTLTRRRRRRGHIFFWSSLHFNGCFCYYLDLFFLLCSTDYESYPSQLHRLINLQYWRMGNLNQRWRCAALGKVLFIELYLMFSHMDPPQREAGVTW